MKRLFFRCNGLTLLGLLGIVATMVILAAILFPLGTPRTRPHGRKSTCQSNVNQIVKAFMMYAQDYDETLPPACTYRGALLPDARATSQPISSPRIAWTNLARTGPIDGYLKYTKVKQCPSGSGASPRLDYAMNWYLGQQATDAVASPGECLLLIDATQNVCAVSAASSTNPPVARHSGQTQITCGFVDGHVKSFRFVVVWPITLHVASKGLGNGNMWAPNGKGASAKEFPVVPR